MKTLDQIEPREPIAQGISTFVISEPGSYYLTGNIQAPPDAAAIVISSGAVTLDLNGFCIFGNPASTADTAAIEVSTPNDEGNITVRNGSIRDVLSGGGIRADSTRMMVYEDLRILNLAGAALTGGDGSSADRCHVHGVTSGSGISLTGGNTSAVRSCIVTEVAGVGIGVQSGIVECCTVEVASIGIEVFSVGGVVDRCVCRQCATGIRASRHAMISNCVLRLNGTGIAADSSLIRGNILRNTVANITNISGGANSSIDNYLAPG
jgi:hypothetical protein